MSLDQRLFVINLLAERDWITVAAISRYNLHSQHSDRKLLPNMTNPNSSTKSLTGSNLIVVCILLCCSVIQYSHQLATQELSARFQTPKGNNKTVGLCGTPNQMARRIEVCAKPVIDILEGTVENWPKTEADSQKLCEDIIVGERCIKDEARRCAKGLHRTIVSTLASSITKARKGECQPQKLGDVLKTTKCIEKHSSKAKNLIANVNNRLNVIEVQMKDLDDKTNAICCVVKDFEQELRSLIKSICPVEGELVLRLYRAVLDDVFNLICRNPKCIDVFKGYRIPKPSLNQYGGIVEIVLRIVFSLGGSH